MTHSLRKEPEMEPCPFCGCKDIRYYQTGIGMVFTCMGCKARGPLASQYWRGDRAAETMWMRRDDAAYLWNKRYG